MLSDGRSWWALTSLAAVLALLAGACHGTPCAQSYPAAEACRQVQEAFAAKCPGDPPLACERLFAGDCSSTKRFCADGLDACVAEIKAASNCGNAGQVLCSFTCFE